MAIDKVVYDILKSYVGNRVYPLTLPENPTYPAITYSQISSLNHPIVNVSYPTFQLDLWTSTYAENIDLRETIINGLDRKKQVVLNYKIRTRYLNYVNFFDQNTKVYHGILDLELFYKEI